MDELSKRIEKTISEYNKEQERKKSKEELENFAEILPETNLKLKHTGLELLEELAEGITGKSMDSEPQYMVHKSGSYHDTVQYITKSGDVKTEFDFQIREAMPNNERIGQEIEDKIEKERAERIKKKFAIVKIENIADWADKEFGGEKIVIGKYSWKDDYDPNYGTFRYYTMANKSEMREWIESQDRHFSNTLKGDGEYSLKIPMGCFQYPVTRGWRGRDGTCFLEKPFDYKTFQVNLKPGELKLLTNLAEKTDQEISKRMDDYNHLFSYWKELDDSLNELNHEYVRRKDEHEARFR